MTYKLQVQIDQDLYIAFTEKLHRENIARMKARQRQKKTKEIIEEMLKQWISRPDEDLFHGEKTEFPPKEDPGQGEKTDHTQENG